MKNAIVVISIGRDSYLQYSLPTIKKYCQKYGIDFEIIKESKWGFENRKNTKFNYNYLNFEKNQTGNYFDKYDRILRLDSDIIITPNCPDLFEMTDEKYIYGVREDVGGHGKNTVSKQITIVKESCGDIPEWKEGFINGGVVLSSKQHHEMYNIDDIVDNIYDINLGGMKEQTYLNWRINKLGFEVKYLDYKFNHVGIFPQNYNNSYIIHFAGRQEGKAERLKKMYNKFYK